MTVNELVAARFLGAFLLLLLDFVDVGSALLELHLDLGRCADFALLQCARILILRFWVTHDHARQLE